MIDRETTAPPSGRFVWPRVWHVWPRSLAARTAVVLLIGLAIVQGAGLAIHAYDRADVQHLAEARDLGMRIASIYRTIAEAPPDQRAAAVASLDLPERVRVRLEPGPPVDDLDFSPQELVRVIRINMQYVPTPPPFRPQKMVMRGAPWLHRMLIGLELPSPDEGWVVLDLEIPRINPLQAVNFLIPFLLMTATAALLIVWGVRQLTAPVRTLAMAAERLGRDVNAPPLPEDGPTEVATAAAAFNTMAARIRRFVQDRTFLLTAIGHDLRTPITRLKLRAEFIDDEELARKFLADLDELEAMVASTLAFGRDATDGEQVAALDLAELLHTLIDDMGDTHPEAAEALRYEGQGHLTVRARPLSLRRALANLIGNAIKYGGGATVILRPPAAGQIVILVEDQGPGLPPGELERVFEPFHRLEGSRNRETGGTGLGLPIARNILRAHGGDVTLSNRPGGGARATVALPA